jgi:hypothetical protein
MSSGLNLAGVRRVLELQAETQRLHAEIERLKTSYRHPHDLRTAPTQPDSHK